RHLARLDEQDVAADRRPCEARRNTRHARAKLRLALETRRAEDRGDVMRGIDMDRRLRALGDPHRYVTQHAADLALEIADAGLARVAADDRPQRRLADRHLLGCQAVRLELAVDEITLRDLELFV